MSLPASDQKPPCATGCSRAQGPSGASPARSSAHRTPGATDNTSPRSRRSDGLRPPCSGLVRPEHRSAATWRRSLQACIASLPLQSSLMSKTYLKSDHFSGGGSFLEKETKWLHISNDEHGRRFPRFGGFKPPPSAGSASCAERTDLERALRGVRHHTTSGEQALGDS